MNELIGELRSAERKALFRKKPMYTEYRVPTEADLSSVEHLHGVPIPPELREFLSKLGYGDINDELSFRPEWWNVLDAGQLKGHLVFGQDDRGNIYTISGEGAVHYIDRFGGPSYAKLADSFSEFIREVIRRKFEVVKWAEDSALKPYDIAT